MTMKTKVVAALLIAALAATLGIMPARVSAQGVLLKDIANVQGVTANQLVGYGVVVGLNQTGDSTSVLFTSQTIQNILQTFGLTAATTSIRTRDVAAVMVTAKLPPFAHSGDNVDVLVSALGDSTTLQGGTLVLTELRGPNNLVYATAQGPISVGGFSAGGTTAAAGQNAISVNFVTAGRIPNGGVIARDMITPLQQDQAGFSYVLSSPDYKTAQHTVQALNGRFGSGTAHALDAETIRVNVPARYTNDIVSFLADAGDLKLDADQVAKVVINERTGTIVMGGDIVLAPVAIAHGNLSITIATANQAVPGAPLGNNPTVNQANTTVRSTESGRKLIYISGAATLSQVVRALNTIGVSPRDLISIVQALRESGSLQANVDII
jgi:flagellar P-ring protein precursor FlgI